MKKMLLLLVFPFLLAGSAAGQQYMLQVQTGVVYTDLTGATSLTQGQLWDDPELTIPLGFTFPFIWGVFDTLYAGDGWCAFNISSDTVLVPYITDMVDRGSLGAASLSSINTKTDGNPGQKIFKLEYKNFGFFDEMDQLGTLNWYGNLQLWLYEDGAFEVRIGPTMIGQPTVAFLGEAGPGIGFGEPNNSHWLTGQANAPVLTPHNNFNIGYLSSVPAEGTVYRFQPYVNAIPETNPEIFVMKPNPASHEVRFSFPEPGTISVVDLTGKMITEKRFTGSGTESLDVDTLPAGTYLVSYQTASGERSTRRLIKQ